MMMSGLGLKWCCSSQCSYFAHESIFPAEMIIWHTSYCREDFFQMTLFFFLSFRHRTETHVGKLPDGETDIERHQFDLYVLLFNLLFSFLLNTSIDSVCLKD